MSHKISTSLISASVVALMSATPAIAAGSENAVKGVQVEANSGTQIEADTLIGKNLLNAEGDTIGEINSVIIGESGKISAIIVGVGGFLGMGEREVAIDWNDLHIGSNQKDTRTTLTKSDLKGMPEYKFEKDEYRNTAFRDNNYTQMRKKSDDMSEKKADWVSAKGVLASNLIGANVVNDQSETIGEVEEVVMNENQPQLILSVGEFLGMGGHNVAVNLDKAKIHQQRGNADDLQVSVAMNKDQLKAMPKFDIDAWKAKANQSM